MVLVSHQHRPTVDKLWGQPASLSLPWSPVSWPSNYSLSPPTQATKIELISHYVKHHSCWRGSVRVTKQHALKYYPGVWERLRLGCMGWCHVLFLKTKQTWCFNTFLRQNSHLIIVRKRWGSERERAPRSQSLLGLLTLKCRILCADILSKL